MTDDLAVDWTDELREQVLPFRGSTEPRTSKPVKTEALVKPVNAVMKVYVDRWKAGAKKKSSRSKELVTATLARFGGVEPKAFDAELEAATLVMGTFTLEQASKYRDAATFAERLVARWVVSEGALGAARALVEAAGMIGVRGPNDIRLGLHDEKTADDYDRRTRSPAWFELRRWLAIAPDYEATRSFLVGVDRELRDRTAAEHATRIWIAVALPDEHSLSGSLIELERRDPPSKDRLAATPLLSCAIDVATARFLASQHGYVNGGFYLPTLVSRLGLDAFAILREFPMPEYALAHEKKAWASAVSVFTGEEPARMLANELAGKAMRPLVGAYFDRHPELAVRVLPEVIERADKTTREAAKPVLETAKRAVDAVRDAPKAATRSEAVHAHDVVRSDAGGGAPPSSIPRVLRDPPWRRKGPRHHLPSRALETVAIPAELAWDDEVLAAERSIAKRYLDRRGGNVRELEQAKSSEHGGYPIALLALADDDRARGFLREIQNWYWADRHIVRALIARFGAGEAEHIARVVGAEPGSIAGVAELGSAHLARPMVAGYGRQKLRPAVQRWLLRFPMHAALGLLPLAFADDARTRKNAQLALRYLASKERADAVRAAAARYGGEVSGAIDEWLAIDPIFDCPSKPPKLPDWLEVDHLPTVSLRDGGALDRKATEHLVEMLIFSEPDPPYEGIAEVARACDPATLDAFVCALSDAWAADGAKSAHAWAVHAVGHLGSEAASRWMVRQVESWASEGSKPKAMLGLEVLGQIGTDVALMHVARWARSGRRQWLKDSASEVLETVAATRGLTADELEDRTAPDLDLGADGSRVLDYGPRRFRVAFDERLAPYLVDEAGSRLRAIPSPRKDDDANLVKAAKETWAALRKDAEHAAAGQVTRLERAMAMRRRWPAADFRAFLVEHPLVGHLSRRLLFGRYDPKLRTAFRIAEDATYSDAGDATMELPSDAIVGIVHPLELDPAALARWIEIFRDYEIVQPFAQLARPAHRATEAERAASALDRIAGVAAYTGRLFALRSRGWRFEGDPFSLETMVKDVGPGLRAVLSFEPPIQTQSPEMTEHTLESLRLSGEGAPTFGRLDPIVFSEIVGDVETLRG